MQVLESFVCGKWQAGSGKKAQLKNPATEEVLAEASTEGVDFGAAMAHARSAGGPCLRQMTFGERGELLTAMSRVLHEHRNDLLDLAMVSGGVTRSDAKFDVDGASGTLAFYGALGKQLGDRRVLLDGESEALGRAPRWVSQHLLLPKRGVAVHINAFNFPAWGLGEKAACALLAGMPILVKPATSTALLTYRIGQLLVDSKLIPEGVFSLVCGSPGNMLDYATPEDVIAFTGGSTTAKTLRSLPSVVGESLRCNIEADSLNAAILGPDAEVGGDLMRAFVRDVSRDITQKTGQKCTAIRRVLVHESRMDDVIEALRERLAEHVIGDTTADGVTMGPVATEAQLAEVRRGIALLGEESEVVFETSPEPRGVPSGKGYFVSPTLLRSNDSASARHVHAHEVFGPCATLLSYSSVEQAAELVRRGGGGLVSSVYSDDRAASHELLLGIGAHHGRVVLATSKIVEQMAGPGTVLPQSAHGGPGRAGGGEELGGLRGLSLYSQRLAVQGDRAALEAQLGKA